jgi:hypothetical protein
MAQDETDNKHYEFLGCMHVMAAALQVEGINPNSVTITLPRDKWSQLCCKIERLHRGFLVYDGHGPWVSFKYMGFTFRPETQVVDKGAA